MLHGRTTQEWTELIVAGTAFLIERARLRLTTSYTETNTVLARRTGQPQFDFDQTFGRASMGALLGDISRRSYPTTGVLLSAVVQYLNENDAGDGFFELAHTLLGFPAHPVGEERLPLWVAEVGRVHAHYRRPPRQRPATAASTSST